jgi:hypothetical protein
MNTAASGKRTCDAVLGNGAERDLRIVEDIGEGEKESAAAYQVTAP